MGDLFLSTMRFAYLSVRVHRLLVVARAGRSRMHRLLVQKAVAGRIRLREAFDQGGRRHVVVVNDVFDRGRRFLRVPAGRSSG